MRHVSDAERRARLATRHALAPAFHAGSPEAATRAMTVLHATEPASVYLSCRARAWADGRIVGWWSQDGDGVVEVRLLETVSAAAGRALDAEAARLTAWLGGFRVRTPFVTPVMAQL